MFYSIGLFIVDSEKEILYLKSSSEVITNNARTVQLVSYLCEVYPKAISKSELLGKLWPNDEVTEWSLSRLISRVRQQLATHDESNEYIRTIHGQGFKLVIEPIVLEDYVPGLSASEVPQISEFLPREANENVQIAPNPFFSYRYFFVFSLLVVVFLLYFFWNKPISNLSDVYGNMYPGETMILPVDSNWVTSRLNTIKFTQDGLLIEPISNQDFFVSTPIFQRVFLQGAIFTLDIEVNDDFMKDGWIGPYFQTKRDNWPGAWDCGIAGKKLGSPRITYDCLIDQNEEFTNVLENEEVVFGVRAHQYQGVGSVLIKSAKVKILPSVDTGKGWHTSKDNKSIQYNRGVSFKPESVEQTLSTFIKGPLNIKGSTLAFTIEIDAEAKKNIVSIELFLVDKNKLWRNCSVFVGSIESKIFTSQCQFESSNPFVLNQDEKIEIGIRPHGKVVSGEIKIIGITVTD